LLAQRTVLLFAGAREAAGSDCLSVSVAPQATAEQVLQAIGEAAPQLTGLLPACRLVADETYVAGDQVLSETAELALIPPVSGG